MSWHTSIFAQHAETASKIMACAALFSVVLPKDFPNTFLAFFLIFSIVAGNYKFKIKLIINNSVALLAIAVSALFIISLTYTSAPAENAIKLLKADGRFIYIPLLLTAFHEQCWKRIGYISFLSGVSMMLLMSYMTLLGWSPERLVYPGSYYYDSYNYRPHTLFHNAIVHGMLVAYAAYLYLHHALHTNSRTMRIFFVVLAALASFNVLAMVASRTGQLVWIALMLLLAYQKYPRWRYRTLAWILVPTMAVTIIAFSDHANMRWINLHKEHKLAMQDNYNSSFGMRQLWAQAGWEIFKHRPITGTGVGSFKNELAEYLQEREIAASKRLYVHNPHNGYISIGVQLGLIGLVFFIALFVRQWRVSDHLPLMSDYAAKGMILTVVVTNFSDSVTYPHAPGLFFVLLTALFFSSYPEEKHTSKSALASAGPTLT